MRGLVQKRHKQNQHEASLVIMTPNHTAVKMMGQHVTKGSILHNGIMSPRESSYIMVSCHQGNHLI